jgi:Protein of unknown function
MITDEEIDVLLLANSSKAWRKVARVVGTSMQQVNQKDRVNKDDLYFAKRVEFIVNKGLLEYEGDLNDMRSCEIRLKLEFDYSGAKAEQ